MPRTRCQTNSIRAEEAWPPVELLAESIPHKEVSRWAEQRIIELKSYNLRFVRAMDAAGVDAGKLSDDFAKALEFLGTADGYLTVTLELLRNSNCRPKEIRSLFNAIVSLAASLGDARQQMLSAMAGGLRGDVLGCEQGISIRTSDVEAELRGLARAAAG
ncbi:MAG: hypothetical protein V2A71_02995 [Candidatus Eisenbacteria bacterium]